MKPGDITNLTTAQADTKEAKDLELAIKLSLQKGDSVSVVKRRSGDVGGLRKKSAPSSKDLNKLSAAIEVGGNDSLPQEDWFAENHKNASEVFKKDSSLPIASPIFSVKEGYNFDVAHEQDFKKRFPFQQKIRGNGACYFNACIAGIINKCVGDSEKSNLIIEKLTEKGFEHIAYEIGQKDEVLTRQKVNGLLQVRGEGNIVRILSSLILVPMHEQFIRDYEAKISDLDTNNTMEEEVKKRLVGKYQEDIKRYKISKLAKYYYESEVSPIIKELFPDFEICPLARDEIILYYNGTMDMDDLKDPKNNKIFLWNPVGEGHFDLLYNCGDLALLKDVEVFKSRSGVSRNFEAGSEMVGLQKLVEESIKDNEASESIAYSSSYFFNNDADSDLKMLGDTMAAEDFRNFKNDQSKKTLIIPFVATFQSGANHEYSSSLYIKKAEDGNCTVFCIDLTGRGVTKDIPENIRKAIEQEGNAPIF